MAAKSNPLETLQKLRQAMESHKISITNDQLTSIHDEILSEFGSQISQNKAHIDDEKNRRGKYADLPDAFLFRLNHRISAAKDAYLINHPNYERLMTHTLTQRVYASKLPFNKLRRVHITNLKLEMAAKGCYVILRVLEKGFTVTGWISVVEDDEGSVCGFTVYNYPSSEQFRVGTVVIVKEPYFKIVMSGDPHVRCDCPTDIIVLSESHPLYHLSEEIDWVNDFFEDYEDPVTKYPEPKSAEEWKLRGNTLFKSSDFVSAREAYLLGLKKCREKNSMWKVLKLNLAAAYLELGYFENAILAVNEVLEIFPDEEKALFRAGKAHYCLQHYDEAFKYFEKLCKQFPGNSDGKREFNKTTTRIEEQKGKVDIANLMLQSRAEPSKKLECADFIGPLKIVEVPGKGRGVVLTEDVKKDTLLIVSKAIAASLDVMNTLGYEMFHDKSMGLRSCNIVVSLLAQMLIKNPNTFGPIFYNLSAGEDSRKEVQLFCDPETKSEPICDVEVLRAICKCNCYGIPISEPELKKFQHNYNFTGSGLFVFPSYINHSCVTNIYQMFINDVMFIFSLKEMKAGEEIVISYVPAFESFKKRKERLQKRGFTCHCKRCRKRI